MSFITAFAYGTALVPLIAAFLVRGAPGIRNARSIAASAAGLVFLLAMVAFVWHHLSGEVSGPSFALHLGAYRPRFGLDGLSLAFLPAVSVVTFAVLLSTPHIDLDAQSLVWVLVGLAGSSLVGVTSDPWVIVAGWWLSFVPAIIEAARRSERLVVRWLSLVAVVSTVALGITAYIVTMHAGGLRDGTALAEIASVAMIVAVVTRLGIFPLHSWIPLVAERTSLPIASTTLAVPLVALVYVRLGIAHLGAALDAHSGVLIALGTLSALYGAVGALGRQRLRRGMGFLTVSMNGVIFTALVSHTEASITGAILQATSAALSITGLLAISHAVLARAGTDDGRHLGGIVVRSPLIATAFLLLSFAFVGFPGTVGFASEDLLLQGVMRGNRLVTAIVLLVTALNGITLYRFYVKVFLGPSHRRAVASFQDLLPRERFAVIGLLVLLIGGGFIPAPLVDIHRGVVEETHGRGFTRDPGHGDVAALEASVETRVSGASRTSEPASR